MTDDCYFFYYSTCNKGAECLYRHEPEAVGQEVTCKYWKLGKCQIPRCKFRHMEITKQRDEIPCFFETQPGGCTKAHCVFKHEKKSKAIPASVGPERPVERPAQSIIVNKSKMSELGLSLPAVGDGGDQATAIRRKVIASSKLVEELQLTRPKLSVKSRLGNHRGVSDVKSRLGPVRADEDDQDIEVDGEEKSLRAIAVQSLDLRKRLDSRRNKRPMDVHSEEMVEEYVYVIEEDEEVEDDQPKTKRLKSEVKKVKKEKKSKKKKKEKKAKKKKSREAEAEGDEVEGDSEQSFSADDEDLDERLSLAHKIAALRDRDGVGERVMQKSQAHRKRSAASKVEKSTEEVTSKADKTEEPEQMGAASSDEKKQTDTPTLSQASSVKDFLQEVDELLND